MNSSLPIISGYALTQEFSNKNAGTCLWSFCTKDGHEYFIKQFLSPKYPADSAEISEKQKEKKRRIANAFYEERSNFYKILSKCRTGNNVVVEGFFRWDSCYYAVSEKIDTKSLSVAEIARLDDDKKMTLMRSVLHSIKALHENGIVHADIKPDNIIVKATQEGYCTAKIIDFEGSYLESVQPENPSGDQVYLAPETLEKINDEEHTERISLTTKTDIFALGVLLHEYWCGERPKFNEDKYHYVHEAVLDKSALTLSGKIPDNIRDILRRMLSGEPGNRPCAAQIINELNGKSAPVGPSKTHESGSKLKINFPKRTDITPAGVENTASSGGGRSDTAHKGFYIPTDLD